MSAANTKGAAQPEIRSTDSNHYEDFRSGGVFWSARAELREEIERVGSGSDGSPEFERLPGCVTVKSTPKRVVWRLPLGGHTVYVKRYRVVGWRERIKYLFALPRAQAEWRTALHLRDTGFEAATPLAVGITRTGPFLGDAWFIAAELPGERFDTIVASARSQKRDLEPLIRAAVDLHERLLRAGFIHPDLHGGNLLVRGEETGTPQIGLIDLHSIRQRARPPSTKATERVRAKLAHSLWLMLEDHEFDRALELLAPGETERVRDGIVEIERVRLRSRSKRCVRVSTSFVRDRCKGWTVWRRRSVDLDSLLQVTRSVAHHTGQGDPFQARIDGELRTVEVQRFGPLGSRSSMRAWKGAHALAVRNIPCRIAFAHLQRWRIGVPWESILVTEALPGAIRLDRIDRLDRTNEADKELAGLTRVACDTATRHHRYGLRARPEDLFAVRSGGEWRVVRSGLENVPSDRPLGESQAELNLAAIRAATPPFIPS